METKTAPAEKTDFLFAFDQGINAGVAPLLLPKNQLNFAVNATVRSTFPNPRPPFWKYRLSFDSDATRTAFLKGLFQEGQYYQPDSGAEYLVAAIKGRLYKVIPDPTTRTAVVSDITGGNPQDATAPQEWMWQAEKWLIWNDGIHKPVLWDGTTTRRSIGQPGPIDTWINTTFRPPIAPGNFLMEVTNSANFTIGMEVAVSTGGNVIVVGLPDATHISVNNETMDPSLNYIGNFRLYDASQVNAKAELPPGKMGTYGLGRNWVCLPDGKRFIASDIVGSPSGTTASDFRDSVLKITENNYLVGGGFFTVPGSIGDIQAMIFTSTLDASLGQGPLQVFTSTHVFSCNAPTDRLTWASLSNPILTESLKAAGAKGQNSTVVWNNDTIFRAYDGIRSLILARREFSTWGNTPQSNEVNERVLAKDLQNLLNFGSAVVFDNRLLMTVSPTQHVQGVYHPGLVAINGDPLSTLGGKKPSVYDGLWNGMNVLKIIVGDFAKVNRAYAFALNTVLNEIELWEVLPSSTTEINDSGTNPIVWSIESPVMDFGQRDPRRREFLSLNNGEVYVDELQSTVNFLAQYKPDQYPCWTDWFNWQECADMSAPNSQPQFRPRMGLGTPSSKPCDISTDRPLRNGYVYQVKFTITGKCRFLGGRFEAVVIPQPKFAKQICP